ncbi:MAG: type I restriction endonuclease subunit R [Fibrobacteria bacterium]|nr:type I restriction endonuclease subunit R [Fibrobacteria bacterium]
MDTKRFIEDFASLLPGLDLLQKLGYKYLAPQETVNLRGGRLHRVILEDVLKAQLRKLNSIEFKGQEHEFSESNIQKAVEAIESIHFDSLLNVNEQIYDLLTLGKSLEQTIDGYSKSYSIHYIDWKNIQNNVFHVTDEFEVERRNSRLIRRPDIVLFVNGLPLVVIECKKPGLKDAVKQGISQHLRNQKIEEIPHLFAFSQILMSIAQNTAMFGTAGTKEKFWAVWKEEAQDKQNKVLDKLVNTKLKKPEIDKMFSWREPTERKSMEEIWRHENRLPSPQDRAIHSLLRPERLLELTWQYVVYDNKVKKLARYQQYFAVNATLDRVKKAKGDQPRKGGVIWHTTGSGKSLTMVMLAKAIALEPAIENPRVVLVTDRVDLDDQIYKTFIACGVPVERATSGENLLGLIKQQRTSVITTVIDKFETASKKQKLKVQDKNVFVLVDESHRSQYGIAHGKMKSIFPDACYIGFTGTPLLRKEKSTAKKFGGFIHKYTMNQAVLDKSVVPLLYEGRMSDLRGVEDHLDRWFERITQDLTKSQKTDLKKKFQREEELTKSGARMAEIAYDIGKHFNDNFRNTGKKGQFAVASKESAIRYKKLFVDFGEVSVDVVMSQPDSREGHKDTDESSTPLVQQFWNDMMARYGNETKYTKSIIDAFKFSDEPDILIVVDKLLTGFDAPKNSVLYLDKRLKEHNILQAIARVNRLFDDKDHGLVIDYRGIFSEIHEAIDTYAALEKEGFDREDVEGAMTNVAEEIEKLPQRHTNTWEIFKSVQNKSDIEAMQLHLESINIRNQFYDCLRLFSKTFQLAMSNANFLETTTDTKLKKYKTDLKFFLNLRTAVKQRFGEAVDYSAYEAQIRNLVNKHIGADEVKQLIKPTDIFAIDDFEKELEGVTGDAAKADVIAARMKKTINEKMEEDPALYQRLSKLIDEAIDEHRRKRIEDTEYLEKILAHLAELRGEGTEKFPQELKGHEDAKAYFGVIKGMLTEIVADKSHLTIVAAEAAMEAESIVGSHKIRDWVNNTDVQNQMRNDLEDYFFDINDRKNIKIDIEQIDSLMDQIISIAKRRDNL